MSDIVFLVGAGRSGTTLLYKLLALHPDVRVITNYDVHFGNWSPAGMVMRMSSRFPKIKKALWFHSGGAAYFKHGFRRFFPLPVEGEPIYQKCGVPLGDTGDSDAPDEVVQCLRDTFLRMQNSSKASVFITKRTANNRRMNWIRQAFPDARFIHLVRDGRDVAFSLSNVNFWRDHTVWWTGRKPGEMEADGWDPLRICAKNWVEDVTAVEKGLQGVDTERLLELRYEQLLTGSEDTLAKVCEFLGLSRSEEFVDAVRSLNIAWRQPKWQRAWTNDQLETVVSEQRDLLSRYEYA